MNTTNERLKEYLRVKGITLNAFALQIGITQSTLNGMIQRGTSPSAKTINAINSNADLNTHWLLTGEGEMLSKKTEWSNNTVIQDGGNSNVAIGGSVNIKQLEQQKEIAMENQGKNAQQEAFQGVVSMMNNTMLIYKELVESINTVVRTMGKDHEKISTILENIHTKQGEWLAEHEAQNTKLDSMLVRIKKIEESMKTM